MNVKQNKTTALIRLTAVILLARSYVNVKMVTKVMGGSVRILMNVTQGHIHVIRMPNVKTVMALIPVCVTWDIEEMDLLVKVCFICCTLN